MNILDKFSLKSRTAIVTGGAQGLGYAMAEAMAQAGAKIAIADINLPLAKDAAAQLKQYGTECLAVHCDVTDEASASKAVKEILDNFGSLDILLNNAGICIHENSEDVSLENWNKVMGVNLDGVFIMSKAVAPWMMDHKQGAIINISSMSGMIVNTPQNQASYNASKAGVIHLTRSMATEWAPYNIRVNTIAPGYMMTAMTKPTFDENGPMVKKWMKFSPMERPGQPDELGGAIVYLASDASSFTTGAVLVVDGGYTCW
jgi:NAD(P)-dependent dehydrogenase (short-subunit alcohol dehydrogenase family)